MVANDVGKVSYSLRGMPNVQELARPPLQHRSKVRPGEGEESNALPPFPRASLVVGPGLETPRDINASRVSTQKHVKKTFWVDSTSRCFSCGQFVAWTNVDRNIIADGWV
jgi:hypothetical protein